MSSMLRSLSRLPKVRASGRRSNSNNAAPAPEAVSEDFASPFWRNTIALGVVSYGVYRFDKSYADSHDGLGYFSGLMDYYRPKNGLWESRNIKHFDLGTEAAATRVLLQSAERPAVRQLRYPAALDLGSPWNTRVDHITDTSAVKVKTHDEVATA